MRQPFYSLVSALVYLAGALFLATIAGTQSAIVIWNTSFTPGLFWAVSGLFFVMAYFSLVHLKYK